MEIFPGISMDPAIRFGKPCLIGTRIDVAVTSQCMGALAQIYVGGRVFTPTSLNDALHVAVGAIRSASQPQNDNSKNDRPQIHTDEH